MLITLDVVKNSAVGPAIAEYHNVVQVLSLLMYAAQAVCGVGTRDGCKCGDNYPLLDVISTTYSSSFL